MSDDEQRSVARFYTRTRNFPKLIGKFTDGTRIPGGPYTLVQGAALVVVVVVGFIAKSLWSTGFVIFDLLILAAAGWGAAFIAGLVPIQSRSLISVATSYLSASFKPTEGVINGKKVLYRKPHAVYARHMIVDPEDPYTAGQLARALNEGDPVTEPSAAQRSAAAPSPTFPQNVPATPARTGAEALLLQMQGGE